MEKDLPKRKASRLKGFDYSENGAYFLTVCTQNRKKILPYGNGLDEISCNKGDQ